MIHRLNYVETNLIPLMHISRVKTSLYEIHVEIAGQPLWESDMYQSISDAVAGTGSDIPEDLACFAEISYEGVSIGTTSTARMKSEPEVIAKELLSRYAAVQYGEDISASLASAS